MASRKLADHYAKAAKTAGYAARSAFKLLEMHEKFQVVKGTVLDLGCHPGAWLQVVSKLQPPDSFALGVDLSATDLSGLKHVDAKRTFTVQSDVFELCEQSVAALRHTACGRPSSSSNSSAGFGTVLSDLAPSTTGSKHTDAAASYALAEHAVRLAIGEGALDVLDDEDGNDARGFDSHEGTGDAKRGGVSHSIASDDEQKGVLRVGGNLVVKLLEGPGGGRGDLQTICKPHFASLKWFRPKATRNESTEVFLVARGRK